MQKYRHVEMQKSRNVEMKKHRNVERRNTDTQKSSPSDNWYYDQPELNISKLMMIDGRWIMDDG